jgi:phage FluMu gp28-like protein
VTGADGAAPGQLKPGEAQPGGEAFVLLPYQQRWVADKRPVKLCEKSRRIGLTWAEAADDVLLAATEGRAGMDVLYLGYNREMTREYIGTCGDWARHFNHACSEVEEFLFEDDDREGDKSILAFRIKFGSGHEIVALSSSPTNLRGRQGRVVIDEAAFHKDLAAVLKSALALLMWGGQVVILSTHEGEENPFNQLCEEIRAGRKPYSLHRTTFDQALEDGLYRRICLIRGIDWTAEGEATWREEIRAFYGDAAEEELDCVPSRGSGAYLLRTVVEAAMRPVPIVRWSPPARDFVDWPDELRQREVADWCKAELLPILESLPDRPSWLGEDFGRTLDLSVQWPLQQMQDLTLTTPFLLELRDCPFTQQEQIFYFVCDRLPRFSGAALDAGGNGAFLAERARQRYGADTIEQIKFSEGWNLENWPPVKADLEDQTLLLPRDADVSEDLRAVRKAKGIPKIPDVRTKGADGKKRHGDAAVALVLAHFAARKFAPSGKAEIKMAGQRRFGTSGRREAY